MIDAQLSINLFDAIIFGVLFLSALVSLFRGFIREVLSLLAWAGAAMITLHLVERVTEWMLPHVNSEKVALIFATMLTYFGALIAISIFNSLILRYVKQGTDVGIADNMLGLVFGVLKGWLVITLGFLVFSLVVKEEGYPDVVATAYTLPAVQSSANGLRAILPEYMRDMFQLEEGGDTDSVIDDEPLFDNLPTEEDIENVIPSDLDELEQLLNEAGDNE